LTLPHSLLIAGEHPLSVRREIRRRQSTPPQFVLHASLPSPGDSVPPVDAASSHRNRANEVIFSGGTSERRREPSTVASSPWLNSTLYHSCFGLSTPHCFSCSCLFSQRTEGRAGTASSSPEQTRRHDHRIVAVVPWPLTSCQSLR
jgi:hypothetical protein